MKITLNINSLRQLALSFCAIMLLSIASASMAETLQLQGEQWKTLDTKSQTTQGIFNKVRTLCMDGKYSAAYKIANKLVKAHEKGTRKLNRTQLEQAMNLRVETLIGRKKYWPAYEAAEAQLEKFPHGLLSDRVMNQEIDIALAFLGGAKRFLFGVIPYTSRGDALDMLQRIAERKMGSDIALRCMMITGDYYFANAEWLDAYDAYRTVQMNLSRRPEAVEAMLKAADAMYNTFEGVYWDDIPLIESEQLYKSYLSARPYSDQAPRVSARLETISDFRAEKDFRVAEYYQRVGRDKSAELYFQQVIARYPASKWAAMAANKEIMQTESDTETSEDTQSDSSQE